MSVLNIEKLVVHAPTPKLQSSLQELDETAFWLELLVEGEIVRADKLEELQKETEELIAIFVSSVKTARSKK